MELHKKRIYSLFLLLLFAWNICSISFFQHSHITGGGYVTHSHPYSGSTDNPGHSHTSAQLLAIAHLSMLLAVLAAALSLGILLAADSVVRKEPGASFPIGEKHFQYGLRAPPVC